MEEIKPRYEFRIWAGTLRAVQEKLAQRATARKTESEETYLISSVTDKCNVKIRAALMDIKVLVAVDRGLEQWKPVLKAGFPLDASVITAQVFPALELKPPPLSKLAYQLDEFLDDVIGPIREIKVVRVHKTRYQFTIGPCATEYAQITMNGAPRDTMAVESVDADGVLALVKELGVVGANTSYIREIRGVLGIGTAATGA
jgi:exopolyphosphatase / guanosine-5'-triphosphate,3'-diphosphate pyrophosphatase